jgi:hypothetical protein
VGIPPGKTRKVEKGKEKEKLSVFRHIFPQINRIKDRFAEKTI